MTNWAEKTWQIGPMAQLALGLVKSYREYPNRPVQTLARGAPEFYADDAVVQRQLQTLIHSMTGHK